MNKKKQGFYGKLKDRYRVNIINPENFEEISSFNASWLQVLMVLSVVFVLAFWGSISMLVYTPFINYFISSSEGNKVLDEKTIELSYLADSLENQLRIQTQYLQNQLTILKGEDDIYSENEAKEITPPKKEVNDASLFYVSPEDSLLRKELASGVYNLSVPKNKLTEALHFYPPVNGIINAGFDAKIGHFAVDLIAEKDAPVKATLDGTVIFSEFSSTTGNVIVIQHLNNYLSIYKHNSVLLKQVGNFVHAGEPIAIIGNSGEVTTGPHLHFELWLNGRPIDPENFIVF